MTVDKTNAITTDRMETVANLTIKVATLETKIDQILAILESKAVASQTAAKVRKVHNYTDEEKKAIGFRLQSARAKNLGLTYEEFKTLHLRPGSNPTKDEMRAFLEARKTAAKK